MAEDWAPRLAAEEARRLRAHCQHFSHLGWALFAEMAGMLLIQTVVVMVVQLSAPWLLENGIFLWILSTVSVYGVGFPLFCLVIRTVPAPPQDRPRAPLGPARLGQAYLIALALLYLSNALTLLLLRFISALRGETIVNPVDSLLEYPDVLNVLLGCVIAPVAEELMFRKLLLDRLRPYGDKFAIIASALCFGLFHGNLYQMFYAFALGLVFGYVALRTGCLWQTILLHAMVNFISTGLIPLLELAGEAGETALGTLIIAAVFLGVVFLIVRRRELRFDRGGFSFSAKRKWRLFFENPGILFFCLLACLTAATYFL